MDGKLDQTGVQESCTLNILKFLIAYLLGSHKSTQAVTVIINDLFG